MTGKYDEVDDKARDKVYDEGSLTGGETPTKLNRKLRPAQRDCGRRLP